MPTFRAANLTPPSENKLGKGADGAARMYISEDSEGSPAYLEANGITLDVIRTKYNNEPWCVEEPHLCMIKDGKELRSKSGWLRNPDLTIPMVLAFPPDPYGNFPYNDEHKAKLGRNAASSIIAATVNMTGSPVTEEDVADLPPDVAKKYVEASKAGFDLIFDVQDKIDRAKFSEALMESQPNTH